MNKEEQHIEATVGKFMAELCNNFENVWRDDAGQEVTNIAFNSDKKYKDEQVDPIDIIIESVIRFYQQKMVEYLEIMVEAGEDIPKRFKYITDRDFVERKIITYFIGKSKEGKAIKKDPLYKTVKLGCIPIEGEMH